MCHQKWKKIADKYDKIVGNHVILNEKCDTIQHLSLSIRKFCQKTQNHNTTLSNHAL